MINETEMVGNYIWNTQISTISRSKFGHKIISIFLFHLNSHNPLTCSHETRNYTFINYFKTKEQTLYQFPHHCNSRNHRKKSFSLFTFSLKTDFLERDYGFLFLEDTFKWLYLTRLWFQNKCNWNCTLIVFYTFFFYTIFFTVLSELELHQFPFLFAHQRFSFHFSLHFVSFFVHFSLLHFFSICIMYDVISLIEELWLCWIAHRDRCVHTTVVCFKEKSIA